MLVNRKTARPSNRHNDDFRRTDVTLYKDCPSGAPVALLRIEGGGHRVPGREDVAKPWADRLLGPQSHCG
jgi:poly(3-hydroxybutyrate) depolymerase